MLNNHDNTDTAMNTQTNPPDFPSHLPKLPEPPKGKKWVYRGVNWLSRNKVHYAYIPLISSDLTNWDYTTQIDLPIGADGHYAELVDELEINSREYQAELAKQWVLEGGFERERWNVNHWRESGESTWTNGVIYRRKESPQPTQDELDTKKVEELINEGNLSLKQTVQAAIEYGRNSK